MTVEEAEAQILSLKGEYAAVGEYAKIDHARQERTGIPEVIFGEGKTPQQIVAIFENMRQQRMGAGKP